MESSWSRNVWEMGLGSLECTLAAPILTIPGGNYIVTNRYTGTGVVFLAVLPDTGSDDPYYFLQYTTTPAHFPYGWTVPPNVPV